MKMMHLKHLSEAECEMGLRVAFTLLMAPSVLRRKIKNEMPLIAHKGPGFHNSVNVHCIQLNLHLPLRA